MSGTNRKSSYQTAEMILDGEIRSLTPRQLRFFAEAHIRTRERELSYLRENELLREQLDKSAFRQHELESLRHALRNAQKDLARMRVRRHATGLPDDPVPTPFALFGWTNLPMGGWSDCLGLFASKAEAQKRKQELRGQWRNLYIVDVRAEQLR